MDPLVPFDWQRMLLGEHHPLFLVEIVLRISIIWPWTMLLLRWIGGRSIAQLSLVEFLLVIALGSAVGDSLFYPEVPLIHAMMVIFVVIAIDKIIDQAIRRIRGAKQIIDGVPVEVLRDGVIVTSRTGKRPIGSHELMELLRLRGVENLGSVRRAFMEPSGQISVFAADPPREGLPITPPLEESTESAPRNGQRCCLTCGQIDAVAQTCGNCGTQAWGAAITAPRLR